MVLLALETFAAEGIYDPTHRQLAEFARCSVPTVRRKIAELVRLDQLVVEERCAWGRGQLTNRYTVLTWAHLTTPSDALTRVPPPDHCDQPPAQDDQPAEERSERSADQTEVDQPPVDNVQPEILEARAELARALPPDPPDRAGERAIAAARDAGFADPLEQVRQRWGEKGERDVAKLLCGPVASQQAKLALLMALEKLLRVRRGKAIESPGGYFFRLLEQLSQGNLFPDNDTQTSARPRPGLRKARAAPPAPVVLPLERSGSREGQGWLAARLAARGNLESDAPIFQALSG